MSVRNLIDIVDDLIKEYGKEKVFTTLKSIIEFFENNT